MERRTYTVTEAATVLGISRTSAYERVRAGELPALRLGRRIVITRAVVDAMLGGAPTRSEERAHFVPDAAT
jgi:excisionase family DNA binding protein